LAWVKIRNQLVAVVDNSLAIPEHCHLEGPGVLLSDDHQAGRSGAGVALGWCQLIARPGGGVVQACPHDSAGKKMPAAFMGGAHDRPGRVTGEGMPGLRACRR